MLLASRVWYLRKSVCLVLIGTVSLTHKTYLRSIFIIIIITIVFTTNFSATHFVAPFFRRISYAYGQHDPAREHNKYQKLRIIVSSKSQRAAVSSMHIIGLHCCLDSRTYSQLSRWAISTFSCTSASKQHAGIWNCAQLCNWDILYNFNSYGS